jgi:hypothetical protein
MLLFLEAQIQLCKVTSPNLPAVTASTGGGGEGIYLVVKADGLLCVFMHHLPPVNKSPRLAGQPHPVP